MIKVLGAAISAAICGCAVANAAVFVENFDGEQINQQWGVYDSAGQFVTSGGAGIEVQRSDVVITSHSGGQHIELDSHGHQSNSAMAAMLDFVAGLTYKMTFAYKPRTDSDNDNGIGFSVGSLLGNSFTASQQVGAVDGTKNTQNNWEIVSMVFTAQQGDDAIQFSALGRANTYGGLIDSIAVELVETPLPAAGLLLLGGLAVIGSTRSQKPLTLG